MSPENLSRFPYPRRRPLRYILRKLSRLAFTALGDFHVLGQENLPKSGPLIVVANHFHFADPVAIIGMLPWPMEFLAGFHLIDAPPATTWLPKLWGVYTVRRGSASRNAMRASMAVLEQKGVLGIFPEGGSWAPVPCPPRDGLPGCPYWCPDPAPGPRRACRSLPPPAAGEACHRHGPHRCALWPPRSAGPGC
jgi:1-acyl-sn-glycerol-3-phosphate acyltransferase